MDYQAEARNGIRFRKLFGTLPDVLVPEMYSELTSHRVLVMEWVEGQRLSEVNDLRLVEPNNSKIWAILLAVCWVSFVVYYVLFKAYHRIGAYA
ncbi:hypothetical protein KC19_6G223500 [Ceratodon purpureus]|nr:hypothetical protein KC19_6G223500 [Ceratodon purpureus]